MKDFMLSALEEAKKAFGQGEVPVGCVIVKNGKVIAAEHNTCNSDEDFTSHAELKALKTAAKVLKTAYLNDCELYVTLEPCPMCMGAIILTGVKTLIYGCSDYDNGAVHGKISLLSLPDAKNICVYAGICEEECAMLLKNFFLIKRIDK